MSSEDVSDRVERNGGGVATFIRQGLSYMEIDASCKTTHEQITVQINTSKRKVFVSNIYCPPDSLINERTLLDFFKRPSAILVGDFNAHHAVFGSSVTNTRGRILNELMDQHNFTSLNTGACTYTSHTGNESPIDLALVSRNISTVCNWTVIRNQLGSDHFPTLTTLDEPAQYEEATTSKWLYKRADWKNFKHQCLELLTFDVLEPTEDIKKTYEQLVSTILKIASNNIPKSNPKPESKNVPYWTDACQEAVNQRNKALNRMKRTKDIADCIDYRKKKGIAQKIIKDAKRNSWKSYCGSLNEKSKMGEIWKTTKKMNGVRSQHNIPNMNKNNHIYETNSDKAALFVKTFAQVSSDENFSIEFITNRENFQPAYPTETTENQQNADAKSLGDEFQYHELKQAIQQCKRKSSPGEDNISYEILKEIPKAALLVLLHFYNLVWKRGELPDDWRHAIIIPISKPTKPNNDPSSYRPISLTSTLCKIMERLIANRMCWFLEKNHIFNKNQSGFRRNRACIDQIMRLQDDIHKSLQSKSNTIGIFIDLEKAFDMIWRDGLLQKLRNIGINGNMYKWITEFLTNRTIQVRIGNELSGKAKLQNGSPQGSVLSPILFLIMMNDIPDPDGKLQLSMFADDCSIWRSGADLQQNCSIVQEYFNKFRTWCDSWGFRISTLKTTAIIFTRKHGQEKLIQIKIGNEEMRFEKSVKFLGVIFDQRLTWTQHINYIVNRCNRRINLLRALSGTDWGANKRTMLMLYRTLIRSVIDYGSIAYDSASKSSKQKLNLIQSKALRICCGAMSMTPVAALQVECGETPLDLRRRELQLQYAAKLIASRNNPTKSIIVDCKENQERYADGREPFGVKTRILKDIIGSSEIVMQRDYHGKPSWGLKETLVDDTLAMEFSKKTDVEKLKSMTEDKILEYSNSIHVYTDASKKTNGRTGMAYRIPSMQIEYRQGLSSNASIFTAEASAILQALRRLKEIDMNQNTSIFTDCLEVAHELKKSATKTSDYIINQILEESDSLQLMKNIRVSIVWIPGHIGITENELANTDAIRAADEEVNDIHHPMSTRDAIKLIESYTNNLWQAEWNASTKGEHYRNIEPVATRQMKLGEQNRKREVIKTRLRLGKCNLNSYLKIMNRHRDGNCDTCNTPETIEHFILECRNNTELVKTIKTSCDEQKVQLNLTNVLKNPDTLNCITDFIIRTKRRI